MSAVAFDTLKFATRLKEAGFTPEQAEAQAKALSEVMEDARGELATRGDIAALRAEFKSDLVQLEQRMVIKLGSMLVVAVAVFAGISKML
jgi:hypothetical protein